jgi:putative peptidoglycan lipid II flippase
MTAATSAEPASSATTTRAAAQMGAATAVSRLAGFVRVLVIAGVLGTTALGNAFGSSNAVSNVLFELLAAGALSAVLVPTFVTRFAQGRDEDCDRLARGLMGYAVVALGLVSVIGVIAAPWIARLLTTGTAPAVAASQRELTTYLLRFFIPQVMLYGFGAVATAVLYARRRFTVTALAPVGNTVVIVVCLLLFRVAAGPDPGLHLTSGERLLLAIAGTGGVIAFVGILVVACVRSGTSLVPQWRRRDPEVRGLITHAGWGTLLHAAGGMLLGAALIAGNSVAGGVVAYQTAFVFFLAPYAVLAQPLHTAVLPDLSLHGHDGDHHAFNASVHDTVRRIALLVAPVSVALIVGAQPGMRLVTFGLDSRGVSLIAAALAGLAIGLLPYSLFLLYARSLYALGDSRTPAFVAIASGLLGVAIMAIGGSLTHDNARVAVMGLGHSAAYTMGALVLVGLLARRVGRLRVVAAAAMPVLVAAGIGVPAWLGLRALAPTSRIQCAFALVVTLGLGLLAYVAIMRTTTRRASQVTLRDAT